MGECRMNSGPITASEGGSLAANVTPETDTTTPRCSTDTVHTRSSPALCFVDRVVERQQLKYP